MLAFLFLSMVAAAGVSLMTDPSGDTENADTGSQTTNEEASADDRAADAPDAFEVLAFDDAVTGTDADETFTINPGDAPLDQVDYAAFDGEDIQYYLLDEDLDVPTVDGGAGEDSFVVEGGHAILTTGLGADSVDASGMQGGLISADAGDTVQGSYVADADMLAIKMDGAGTVTGGSASEILVAEGDGAEIDGGAGDDLLLSVDGAATLNGGDGNDVIDANANPQEYDGSTGEKTNGPDAFVDIIDAGAGDDRVSDVANGDRVTLGEGRDTAFALYDQQLDEMGPVTFTDFDPSNDRAYLEVVGVDAPNNAEIFEDEFGNRIATLEGRVEVIEGDGDSHVFVDETLVAVFENTAGLRPETYVTFDRVGDVDGVGVRFLPA